MYQLSRLKIVFENVQYAQTYPAFLLLKANVLAQLQIGCNVHIFTNSEQRLETIILCNIAGHTTERGCI